MKISERTIKRLGEIITGDKALSPYRGGPKLVAFFILAAQTGPHCLRLMNAVFAEQPLSGRECGTDALIRLLLADGDQTKIARIAAGFVTGTVKYGGDDGTRTRGLCRDSDAVTRN
jgi:hypothetical protein